MIIRERAENTGEPAHFANSDGENLATEYFESASHFKARLKDIPTLHLKHILQDRGYNIHKFQKKLTQLGVILSDDPELCELAARYFRAGDLHINNQAPVSIEVRLPESFYSNEVWDLVAAKVPLEDINEKFSLQKVNKWLREHQAPNPQRGTEPLHIDFICSSMSQETYEQLDALVEYLKGMSFNRDATWTICLPLLPRASQDFIF